MQSPAPKLGDFHAFHEACGSIVDIKPDRRPIKDGQHAFFAWCPACGATSREVVNLAEIDNWFDSGIATTLDGNQFARAMLRARLWPTSS